MSRAYRISVSESVKKHIRVSDGIKTQLELLAVLGAEAMAGLLAADLTTRGFELRGQHMVREDEDGVEVAIGVSGDDAGHVTVRLTRDKSVDIEVERSRQVYIDEVDADAERQSLKNRWIGPSTGARRRPRKNSRPRSPACSRASCATCAPNWIPSPIG